MGWIYPTEDTIREAREQIARGEAPVCPGLCPDFENGTPGQPFMRMVHPDAPYDTEWLCPYCHYSLDAKGGPS